MAKVDQITGENIERFRGIIDFYMYAGKIPVARSWPNKPKPPYSAIQAQAMAVFSLAARLESRITGSMLLKWQESSEGIRSQWTDVFKGIIMHYWKITGTIAPIALSYTIIDAGTQFRVSWNILQAFLNPLTPEVISTLQTTLINKSEMENVINPIYFTLTDNAGERLVAPYILFEV